MHVHWDLLTILFILIHYSCLDKIQFTITQIQILPNKQDFFQEIIDVNYRLDDKIKSSGYITSFFFTCSSVTSSTATDSFALIFSISSSSFING